VRQVDNSTCHELALPRSTGVTLKAKWWTTTSDGLTGVINDQSSAIVPNVDVEIKDNTKGTTQIECSREIVAV
jgi:hypothetical protein